jgi:hypothetical protein
MRLTYISDSGRSVTMGGAPFVLESVAGIHGLTATVYDYQQYRQDCSVYVASRLEPRDITLGLRILTDVVANRLRLLETFDPKVMGRLVLQRDGFVWQIACVVTQAPQAAPTHGGKITVQLRAQPLLAGGKGTAR